MQLQKSEKQSAIITTIVTILLLLFLLFFGMSAVKNEVDEGVMVSFGADGLGDQIPTPQPTTAPVPTTTPVAAPEPEPDENLMTQEDESVAMQEEERKRKEKERNEQLAEERRKAEEQRQKEEQLRKEEEARQEAERIRQEKINKANKLGGNAFANKDKGSGTTTGETVQGNPTSSGVSPDGSATFSLNGREIVGKFYKPTYSGNQQGIVVVTIRVDAGGNVTSAEIATGTTVTNESMRKASIEAAKKNKFTTGGAVAIGTITFKYTLN